MTPRGLNWDAIIADLALHLASASSPEHVNRILSDAESDLARLGPPAAFWCKLRDSYEKLPRRDAKLTEVRDAVSRILRNRSED
jgi:hypothetical protein